ncbi:MAG: tRNA dihydrouridine synthase DusB [Candidatus Marithrix sp.]|nr:tRNA dihydrouridine synthase DusB [Candidatus Marithrix sp.]
MKIGNYTLKNNIILAPMAGITDKPFRRLCTEMGAGMTMSEMVSSNSLLWGSNKTLRRACNDGTDSAHWVQILGADPKLLARAAQYNVANGAEIIDINMGCPAKKVCNTMAGSALLKDENLVANILETVVKAVEVPVTLKIRTGWDKEHRNGLQIAKIAEQAGIQTLSIHGRTRACKFTGEAEYDTIANIKANLDIPIIANGDIDSPEKAEYVLDYTKADAVMIGRAAFGRPWLFQEIVHYLQTGTKLPSPTVLEIRDILLQHLDSLYQFYGEYTGIRMARKHLSWYTKGLHSGAVFRNIINRVDTITEQVRLTKDFFNNSYIS